VAQQRCRAASIRLGTDLRGTAPGARGEDLATKNLRRSASSVPANQIAGYRNSITQCRESTFLNILRA
ncbi:MAG: hypothetical protein ACHQAQ_06350, partial [Hyphomicrobiales bacterium]